MLFAAFLSFPSALGQMMSPDPSCDKEFGTTLVMKKEGERFQSGDQLAEAVGSSSQDSTSAVEKKLVKNAGYFNKPTFSALKRKYFYSIYVSLKR